MKSTKQLVKFDFDTAIIVSLETKYKDIQITDGKSYAVVMQGLAEYRKLRLAIDDKHKELKQDILEAGRSLDGDKNRLKALLEPGENHLKKIRQVEDDKKAAIKEEKDRKERERIEAIQEKINSIRRLGIVMNHISSSTIKETLIIIKGQKLTKETYMEYMDQALQSQKEVIASLEEILTDRLQFENEVAERDAEAERLEAQRKEQEAAQAKIDEENRKIEKEKQRLERVKEIEKTKKEREEFKRQAKEEADKSAKARAQQAEIERERREEAEEKEKVRQEALRPDREKLIKFADELLEIDMPHLKLEKGRKLLDTVSNKLADLAREIKEQAKEL